MADVRPFRALRYDPHKVDLAQTIAPPYDVISPSQQAALYERSPYNIVRVEYGEEHDGDTAAGNRYTRAVSDLRSWMSQGELVREANLAMYSYRLEFEWEGTQYERSHYFGVVRLEEWENGVVKPHEHTLSGPKADRMELLRATRTQVSPVYCMYQRRPGVADVTVAGKDLYDAEADGQRHKLATITDDPSLEALRAMFAASDFYIADGHHRYETALAYRNECIGRASSWTGEEPENFVLMAMTDASDPGLLVLPTHRLVHRSLVDGGLERIKRNFEAIDLGPIEAQAASDAPGDAGSSFVAFGIERGHATRLVLRDRAAVEALMPASESPAWKRLDVNVLQYGILQYAFGIDEAALKAGGAVSYIQSPAEAANAVERGDATAAFLLQATPVEQIIDVSDVDGRMPQKSTYFYPKLPTGLVLNAFD